MSSAASFAALLAAAQLPRHEARALLEHASGRSREWLIAHDDEAAPAGVAEHYREACRRRIAGEPLAYLLGEREFWGRSFEVAPGVLIPRPETELLVEWALELLAGRDNAAVIDLGTGSGCIAVTLAAERPDLRVCAVDTSADALPIAARNAARWAPDVELIRSNWFDAVDPRRRFDLIVSNPPYIAAHDPHLEAGDLRFEPSQALASGREGLDAIRLIAACAGARLATGGWLLVEHGWQQAGAVREIFAAAGLVDILSRRDLAGIERACVGRMAV